MPTAKPRTIKPRRFAPGVYYVGSPYITQGWAKESLEEALDHAARLTQADGQARDVVKVVARVKRVPPPVEVEFMP